MGVADFTSYQSGNGGKGHKANCYRSLKHAFEEDGIEFRLKNRARKDYERILKTEKKAKAFAREIAHGLKVPPSGQPQVSGRKFAY